MTDFQSAIADCDFQRFQICTLKAAPVQSRRPRQPPIHRDQKERRTEPLSLKINIILLINLQFSIQNKLRAKRLHPLNLHNNLLETSIRGNLIIL
jgi:hypothetical protein